MPGGTGTVDWGIANDPNNPASSGGYDVPKFNFANSEDGSNCVTLVCFTNDNPDDVKLTNNPTDFYIVVPSDTLDGTFNVEVMCNDGTRGVKEAGGIGHIIVRSRIRPMETVFIECGPPCFAASSA